MNRLVIVGESNPYGSSPSMALYHLPRRASGDRLREHLGLTDETYEALDKVNLCAGHWSTKEARVVAEALTLQGGVLVLLGAKVRAAFVGPCAFAARTFAEIVGAGGRPWYTLVSMPHPSGLCRAWNEPGARLLARNILATYAPWVPWGETDRVLP